MHDFSLDKVSKLLGIEAEIQEHRRALVATGTINDSQHLKWLLKQLILSSYPNLDMYFPGLRAGVKL